MIVGEGPRGAPDAAEQVSHSSGHRSQRVGVFRDVLVLRDLAHVVRSRARDKSLEREPTDAMHDDVRSTIGQGVRVIDFGNTADASRLELGFTEMLGAKHDPEPRVRRQAVAQHLPIARLEDVQRERRAGKQHQRQWEQR